METATALLTSAVRNITFLFCGTRKSKKARNAECGTRNAELLLTSVDGETFQVPKALSFRSGTIRHLVENLNVEEKDNVEIPLTEVNGTTLRRIVEWLTGHGEDMAWDEQQEKDNAVVDEWDKQWLAGMEQKEIFEVIKAANYLEIKRLLDNACKAIAGRITGHKVEYKFDIPNDYTKEEEDAIRLENAWLED